MNRIPFFLVVLVGVTFLTGCFDVTFEEPMPLRHRNLAHFPKTWRGQWMNDEGERIQIGEYSFANEDSSEVYLLGESHVLRRYRDCLVLNQWQDEGGWGVVVARRRGGTIQLYTFDGSDEAKVAIWREVLGESTSSKQVMVQSGIGPKTQYHLAPENNAAWRKLLQQGGLTPLVTYVKVE